MLLLLLGAAGFLGYRDFKSRQTVSGGAKTPDNVMAYTLPTIADDNTGIPVPVLKPVSESLTLAFAPSDSIQDANPSTPSAEEVEKMKLEAEGLRSYYADTSGDGYWDVPQTKTTMLEKKQMRGG